MRARTQGPTRSLPFTGQFPEHRYRQGGSIVFCGPTTAFVDRIMRLRGAAVLVGCGVYGGFLVISMMYSNTRARGNEHSGLKVPAKLDHEWQRDQANLLQRGCSRYCCVGRSIRGDASHSVELHAPPCLRWRLRSPRPASSSELPHVRG